MILKDLPLLLAKDRTFDSTTYKLSNRCRRNDKCMGDYRDGYLETNVSSYHAEFWNNTYMGKNPFHRIAGNYKNFLYYNGGKKSISSIVDICF